MASSLWDSAPIVTLYRSGCPYCGCEKYIPFGTRQNGDDTSTRRAICKGCSERYITVLEPLPMVGNHILWPDTIQASTT